MSEINEPVAHIVEAWPNRTFPGSVVVKAVCPFCGNTHTHGIPRSSTDLGHRTADCFPESGPSDYLLVDSAGILR